ncbi:Gfo/Idh/MocA family oxidoreductase [Companilactobacillus ginsenosidimutans]|uniref:Inositol 2-dehydrogenase n=1 Tax=Companilactobacillus ginsenosidimutans TaxID=1007676 RepID=A0A0H4QHI0_9LACO|nr:Gfo/Idh/MocA family oxidoreductase [Companilactobacillus ginsenosidimutans]AKP67874.1 inositol 2-dehydrogenase [Companilactobacillus ginsenosidimutans]
MVVNVGLIGVGAIGKVHIERMQNRISGAQVVAVCDLPKKEAETKQIAKEIGAEYFSDGFELIKSDKVDAVVITTNDPAHPQYTLAAIEANKHVFCEKPMAVDPADCIKVMDAEMKHGKRLVQVGFMRAFDRGYDEVKAELESHKYGDPLLLHCTHRNPSVGTEYDTPMAVENTAVHEMFTLPWLLGENFISAKVTLPRKQTRNTHSNLHDPQMIYLETESGVLVDLEVFVNCQWGYDINCKVVCETGEISLLDPHYHEVKTANQDSVPISEDWSDRFIQAYDSEFQSWTNSVIADKTSGPSAWDGYCASVSTAAASKSRETGKTESINLIDCPDPEFYGVTKIKKTV